MLRRTQPDAYTITNTGWEDGMAGSLAVGLGALPRHARAAMLLVSDQPFVGAESIERLARAWLKRPMRAAGASYDGVLGVPAILPRSLWRAALALEGDAGARLLLRENGTTKVPMPEAAFDVDTAEDRDALLTGTGPRG